MAKTTCAIYVERCDECGELKTWRYKRRSSRACSRACENKRKARRAREKYTSDPESERRRVNGWRSANATPCVDCGRPTVGLAAKRCGACQRMGAARLAGRSHRRRWAARAYVAWVHSRAPMPLAIEAPAPPPAQCEPRQRHFVAGNCWTCGEPFVAVASSAKYCSPDCRPKWGHWIESSRRAAIYERDGWVCQICSRPIPIVLIDHRHPLSPTLDHVVPKSLGGGHESENLRLAHRLCNSIRSDESNPSWRQLIPAA